MMNMVNSITNRLLEYSRTRILEASTSISPLKKFLFFVFQENRTDLVGWWKSMTEAQLFYSVYENTTGSWPVASSEGATLHLGSTVKCKL